MQVAYLVEAPAPLLGTFDAAFLTLPREVLTTVMRKHQRYFPVEDAATGQLKPAFVTVCQLFSSCHRHLPPSPSCLVSMCLLSLLLARSLSGAPVSSPQVANGPVDLDVVRHGNEAVLR